MIGPVCEVMIAHMFDAAGAGSWGGDLRLQGDVQHQHDLGRVAQEVRQEKLTPKCVSNKWKS